MNELPKNYNYKYYLLLNPDLHHLNEEKAKFHYLNFGYMENRKFTIIPDDFNYKEYLLLNQDLNTDNEDIAINHYVNYGYYENREYKKKDFNNNKIHDFLKINNISLDQFQKDYKIQFRYICFDNINYIKNFVLPEITINSELEAVLIEFRILPHLEFIIRNNIIKLGMVWSFTVICGNINFEFIQNICKNISNKIKVIKTDFDNMMPSQYSNFLTNLNFWNLLTGKKILIYQEDSLIFKNNFNDFLHFDFIGAPWSLDNNDNKKCVGNGGLSLRTRDIMIKIIKTINIQNTIFNTKTLEYIKNTNSSFPPEDVYFTKNMEDFNIGNLADRENAYKFSTESLNNPESMGGHCFWHSDPDWKNRMYKNNIIKFKPHYQNGSFEHRGGWNSIMHELNKAQFFNLKSEYYFFDIVEKEFLWKQDFYCKNKWAGIIHCTEIAPPYLDIINIENMFKNPNFILSLNNCIFIVSLSNKLTNYLKKKINIELNLKINIYTLFHPVVTENIPLFNLDLFISNENKILIQIGQQLRKMSSIYLLNVSCNKMWLTGTKNFEKMNDILNKEIQYLNLDQKDLNSNVCMHYTETYEEYDNLLTKNLVFADFFDASANNTVLECIVRNTPIFLNKIEGIVEYLGEDYPLYFETLEDVKNLLTTTKIVEAHEYLKNMDKTKFEIDYFINELFKIIQKDFL